MPEITNANDVRLVVKAVGGDGVTMTDRARVTVDSYSIGSEEENEAMSGVGNHKPVAVTRGNVTYNFSFTIQGEDAELFETIALDDGRAREIEFQAIGVDFVNKALGAYLTEFSNEGSDGDAVEYSVTGIATGADFHAA